MNPFRGESAGQHSHAMIRSAIIMLMVMAGGSTRSAQAQFPSAGADSFDSKLTFRITLTSCVGGATITAKATGPTVVLRSGPHTDTGALPDISGPLGSGSTICIGDPKAGTTDLEIGLHPAGYETGLGTEEVHTEICDLFLTSPAGWVIRAGDSAPARSRSLGEVESRPPGSSGFPADSFFNLFVEVDIPAAFGGPLTVFNATGLTIEANGITSFPPAGDSYIHTHTITGRVMLFDVVTGCFVGWLEEGGHGVSTRKHPVLPQIKLDLPIVFSVNCCAEGLLVPGLCPPFGHCPPNDVFALGPVVTAGAWGYATEGELFQSSGLFLGLPPDMTNIDRFSAALGIGPAPLGGPPFVGPFFPNPGAPIPIPAPPGGPVGTLGLVPRDNVNALSFGLDRGRVLLFSVDTTAVGVLGSAVNFHAILSPPAAAIGGFGVVPSNGGGDPGNEAAGDIYVSTAFPFFPPPGVPAPPPILVALPAAPAGTNFIVFDELDMGLQAPAVAHSALCKAVGPPGARSSTPSGGLSVGSSSIHEASGSTLLDQLVRGDTPQKNLAASTQAHIAEGNPVDQVKPDVNISSPEIGEAKLTARAVPTSSHLGAISAVSSEDLGFQRGIDTILGGTNESTVAVSPVNPQIVAMASLRKARVSMDGGVSWSAEIDATVPATHGMCGDPSLAFDSAGRLFWTYLGCIGNGIDIFITQLEPDPVPAIPPNWKHVAGYPVNVTAAAGLPANAAVIIPGSETSFMETPVGSGTWEYKITVPPQFSPNDIHVTFTGTGGLITLPTVVPAGVATVTGGGNTVNVTWAAPLAPGTAVTITFQNPNPGLGISGGHWTLNGVNIWLSHDKEWLAADCFPLMSPFANRLYVVWTQFISLPAAPFIRTRIVTTHSVNQGLAWTPALQISAAGGGEGFVWPSHNAVAPNGDVYIAYHSQPELVGVVGEPNPNGVNGRVHVARSINGGVAYPQKNLAFGAGFADITFNVQTQAGTIAGTDFWMQGSAQPWVLPDPKRPGNIYVVVNDDPNAHGAGDDADVLIVRSTNNGVAWGAPARIDSGPGTTFQVMPTAAIDKKTGCIVVHYYDNRNGAVNAGGNFLLDVFATSSDDGGLTFTPDVQINDVAFDPDPGAQVRFAGPPPTTRIGEYNGVATDGCLVHAVWTGNTLNAGGIPIGQQAVVDDTAPACCREDDLDALEADDGVRIDMDVDGVPDGTGKFSFFSIDPHSPTVKVLTPDPFPGLSTAPDPDGVTPDDVLVAPPPGLPPFLFSIYASGVLDIGLLLGDDLDALVLVDNGGPDGILTPGLDAALFSLAAGSPSLAAGANPNMPGAGPFSPGDVFITDFTGPVPFGTGIGLYATSGALGLLFTDELNALDIGGEIEECPYAAPPGLSFVGFGIIGGTNPAIPAGFFGPGSDPFSGQIDLQGVPIDPQTSGDTSMVSQRSVDPIQPDEPIGTVSTVEIELVALNLVSVQPIIITENGGLNPTPWNVEVGLSATPVPIGQMTVTKTHNNGGTFNTNLPVMPIFIFTNVVDPLQVVILDSGEEGFPPHDFQSIGTPWVHQLDPSLQIFAPSNGIFVPGVEEIIPGDPTSQQIVPLVEEDLLGPSQHTVVPPIPPTPCITCRGDMNGTGIVEPGDIVGFVSALLSVDPDLCADMNLDTLVNGLDIQLFVDLVIAQAPCGTACPCNGDMNGDGLVSAADLPLFVACLGAPPPPGCEQADLDCNGVVDAADQTILFCQIACLGDPICEDLCCSP